MNATDTQSLLVATMQKIASKKEEKKEEKKPPEKEVVKGMGDCKYAMKVAEQLDYLLQYSEAWLGSPIERATKVAGSLDVPGILPHSKATGPDGKAINEKRDSMAVGEQPAATSTTAKGTFEGVPNMIENTLDKKPGGSPEKPSDPPLYNKTAYQKVLSKLASNKIASDTVPNELKRMDATESGKGQSGYDSGGSHGNDKRSLVDTDNRKAMDYTKGDAKKSYIKEQMGEVFDEVHPEKDTALDRAFQRGVETAKMAGVEDAKKMKAMAIKEVEEEKKEEKLYPGIHKEIEKKAGLGELLSGVGGKLRGAGQAVSGAASRAGELLQGGSPVQMTREVPGIGKITDQIRPGNLPSAYLGQHGITNEQEALKSLAARAGLGAGILGGGALAAHGLSEKAAEEKCTCDGKGVCKVCKEKVTKLAYVFRAIKEAEQIPTNAPAGSTPDVTAQVNPQMEQGTSGGEEDEIEKLKKMLLVMQMMKQQKLQEQMPAIDQAAPGAGSAADTTAAMSGPTTGAV
jgi:hypothetical protein